LLELALQARGDQDQPAALERAIARLRRVEGDDGVFWRYGQAAFLLLQADREDQGRLGEARVLLAEVAWRRPGWSRVPLQIPGL
jgi:hypothetical protein